MHRSHQPHKFPCLQEKPIQTKQKNVDLVEKVVENAFKKGLHLVCDHESVVQLMPPLTISKEEIDKGIEILLECIKESN